MKRKLVPVHVNGIFVCDTDEKNIGVYQKWGQRWYIFSDAVNIDGCWRPIGDEFKSVSIPRKVLSKALRYYRWITPSTYPYYKNPVVIIGKPPEEPK